MLKGLWGLVLSTWQTLGEHSCGDLNYINWGEKPTPFGRYHSLVGTSTVQTEIGSRALVPVCRLWMSWEQVFQALSVLTSSPWWTKALSDGRISPFSRWLFVLEHSQKLRWSVLKSQHRPAQYINSSFSLQFALIGTLELLPLESHEGLGRREFQ